MKRIFSRARRFKTKVESSASEEAKLARLFGAPFVSSFEVSNSGDRIAYSWNRSAGRTLHLLQRDSSGNYSDHTISELDGSYEGLRFIRDGKGLLFLNDRDGDEKFDIYLGNVDARDGTFRLSGVVNLTPDTDFSILPQISVDRNGKEIAFVSDRDGTFASYILDMYSHELTRVSHHDFSDNVAALSPDGSMIAFAYSKKGQESAISVQRIGDGDPYEIGFNGTSLDADSPCWSSDGRYIAFCSNSFEHSRIGVFDTRDASVRWISDERRDCSTPVFSRTSMNVAYLMETELDSLPVISSVSNPERRKKAVKVNGLCLDMKFGSSDTEIAMLLQNVSSPSNVCIYRAESEEVRWLTKSFQAGENTYDYVMPQAVKYASSHDGMEIPALLYLPRNSGSTHPVLIYIHGGPTWRTYARWDPLIQSLVWKGVAVICPDYRGSSGHGKKFREANRYVMGVADLSDCVSARNYLLERGIADRDRIAVAGESFGGYLTMCALTGYPDLWCAGSATVPFINWFTEMESERGDLRYWDLQNMGDPVRDRERLTEASPAFFIERIRAPVQIIAGANDPRCPLTESLQAKQKLEGTGVELDFKYYENEGHSFDRMENIVDSMLRTYRFLIAHLLR